MCVFVRVLVRVLGACRCHRPKKSLALGFLEMIITSGRPRGIFDSWHLELEPRLVGRAPKFEASSVSTFFFLFEAA